MTQRTLSLPPVRGELPLGEYAISPMTSCAYCTRRLPQRQAYTNPSNGEHYCNKSCRDMADQGDMA